MLHAKDGRCQASGHVSATQGVVRAQSVDETVKFEDENGKSIRGRQKRSGSRVNDYHSLSR